MILYLHNCSRVTFNRATLKDNNCPPLSFVLGSWLVGKDFVSNLASVLRKVDFNPVKYLRCRLIFSHKMASILDGRFSVQVIEQTVYRTEVCSISTNWNACQAEQKSICLNNRKVPNMKLNKTCQLSDYRVRASLAEQEKLSTAERKWLIHKTIVEHSLCTVSSVEKPLSLKWN